ncbi:MAG TPA: hypothetical protein VH054_07495 [Polyangiaceae bacterium]|jgi:hypothetical protein|nr:hypothetical protein [Polyangiaceae bacterium]
MTKKRVGVLAAALVGCSAFDPDVGDPSPPIDAGPPVVFSRDIRPMLDKSCKRCHYSTQATHIGLDGSGLDLATLGSLRRGGNDTHLNIVVPYAPEGSALVLKLQGTFTEGVRMPKYGPYWTDDQIAVVATWIAQGAQGDDSE